MDAEQRSGERVKMRWWEQAGINLGKGLTVTDTEK